jgi:predicted PurR-regulated permease PerM
MHRLIPLIRFALILIIGFLIIYGAIVARNLLYPLAFGGLFAYLLLPVCMQLEKWGIHRIPSILLSILLALLVLSSVFLIFQSQLGKLFDNLESLKNQADANIEVFQDSIGDMLGLNDNTVEDFLKSQVDQFFGSENNQIQKIFTTTTGTLLRIIILPVYIFLFLFYRTKFAYFILKIVKKKNRKNTIHMLRDVSTVAGRYMGGVSIVVLILCVINSLGLTIIGVEFAVLLGITSAFFNFIPYFGTLMGGSIPIIFVLLTSNDPLNMGLQVIIFFLIVQFTENNILTPNIVGGNVKINPFFIIVGLVVGAAIWGIPGMLLIIPFLAVLKIMLSHIEHLRPYAFLLGQRGTQKHSITGTKIGRSLEKAKNAVFGLFRSNE